MKNLKITLIIVFLVVLNPFEMKAQEANKKAERIEQMKLTKERLSLSEQQEVTFREITKKYYGKLKEVKDVQGSKKEKIQKMNVIRSEKNAEMKILLSESQYKIYLEIQEEHKNKRKDKKIE